MRISSHCTNCTFFQEKPPFPPTSYEDFTKISIDEFVHIIHIYTSKIIDTILNVFGVIMVKNLPKILS